MLLTAREKIQEEERWSSPSHSSLGIFLSLFLLSVSRGSQWGGGFYGYRLKFWFFYGYRLIFFLVTLNKKLKINFFCFKELNIDKPVFFVASKQSKGLRIISG